MNKINAINADVNANEIIDQHYAEASGWNVEQFLDAGHIFSSVAFYLVDYPSMHTRLVVMPQVTFDTLDPHAPKHKKYRRAASSFAAQAMSDLIKNPEDKSATQTLSLAMACYFKTTQSYSIWLRQRSHDSRLHVLMNLYRKGNDLTLRPAAIRSQEVLIAAGEINETSMRIAAMDLQNHPEYFA